MPSKFQQPTKKKIQLAAGMHTKQFKNYDENTQKFFVCCPTKPKTAFKKIPKRKYITLYDCNIYNQIICKKKRKNGLFVNN